MAFGFPAAYAMQSDLTSSRHVAREAVVYAFELLEWHHEITDADNFRAQVPISGSSWGENFTVSLETPGVAIIRSVCRYPLQLFDWGKNRQNVDRFLAHFSPKELREGKLRFEEATYLDEQGNTPVARVLMENETAGVRKDKE